MSQNNTFRFFTARRVKGGFMLFLRGQQVASIYKEGNSYVAFRASEYGCSDSFSSISQAEAFVWGAWV